MRGQPPSWTVNGYGRQRVFIFILLEWPNGERAAIIFAFEHEGQSGRFSIHRLAYYTLGIGEFYKTNRVVPVTVFQNPAPHAETELKMGSETQTYLDFRYIQCVLNRMEASAHYQSTNIIARNKQDRHPNF